MDWTQDPVALVLAFVDDYYRWNTAANARLDKAGESGTAIASATTAAEREYRALLKQYCRPGFTGEPVVFGSPSLHHPKFETIASSKPRGDRCLIKTCAVDDEDEFGVEVNFEYRLVWADGRWYLERVTVVDETGRYESL
ncbi:hypothetical protein J0H58_18055 [bacterium]|nr:hypothetical protein [bacterium]